MHWSRDLLAVRHSARDPIRTSRASDRVPEGGGAGKSLYLEARAREDRRGTPRGSRRRADHSLRLHAHGAQRVRSVSVVPTRERRPTPPTNINRTLGRAEAFIRSQPTNQPISWSRQTQSPCTSLTHRGGRQVAERSKVDDDIHTDRQCVWHGPVAAGIDDELQVGL